MASLRMVLEDVKLMQIHADANKSLCAGANRFWMRLKPIFYVQPDFAGPGVASKVVSLCVGELVITWCSASGRLLYVGRVRAFTKSG
jgi:hypothetical protein